MEPHELTTHPHYPDGFPDAADKTLFGRHKHERGHAHVVPHHHGYEVHFSPCEDCEACKDGRFRDCPAHGPILTVAGDHPEAVVEYLADLGSEKHAKLHRERVEREAQALAQAAREYRDHIEENLRADLPDDQAEEIITALRAHREEAT